MKRIPVSILIIPFYLIPQWVMLLPSRQNVAQTVDGVAGFPWLLQGGLNKVTNILPMAFNSMVSIIVKQIFLRH